MQHEPLPNVSVILLAYGPPALVQASLRSVLEQDTDGYEVVVVGVEDAGAQLEGSIRPLHVLHLPGAGEGEARHAGMRAARADLIAWCDPGDVWTADHLRLLREALQARPEADLVYALPQPLASPAWPPGVPAHVARSIGSLPPAFGLPAGCVLHRAEAANVAGGFILSQSLYAAQDLWIRMADLKPFLHVPRDLRQRAAAARLRGGNVRRERARVLTRLSDERAWANASRQRRERRARQLTTFDPATWQPGRRRLVLQTQLAGYGSFDVVASQIIPALQSAGVEVILPIGRSARIPAQWRRLATAAPPRDCPALNFDWRTSAAEFDNQFVVEYFMWESTMGRRPQVEEINAAASALFVPCRENMRIAAADGVTVPIRLLHHGINRALFPYVARDHRPGEPFTFGCTSALGVRKGTDLLIRAFLEEFAPHEPARLLLRQTYNTFEGELPPADPRIAVITAAFHPWAPGHFMQQLDAYVLPSRGEGFCLTALEAMATGLPTIVTNWGGPAEYLDLDDSFPLNYAVQPTGACGQRGRVYQGYWVEPDLQHLRQLMRYVYEEREAAAAAGRRASQRVHRDWGWERSACQFVTAMDAMVLDVAGQV